MSGQVMLNKVTHCVVLNRFSLNITAPLSIHMSYWNQPERKKCNVSYIYHCPQGQRSLTTCAHCRGGSLMPLGIVPVSHVSCSCVSGFIEKFFNLGRDMKPCATACPEKKAYKDAVLQSPIHCGMSIWNLDFVNRSTARNPSSIDSGSWSLPQNQDFMGIRACSSSTEDKTQSLLKSMRM